MLEGTAKALVYFAKGCGGWLFAGVNGLVYVHDEVRTVLSDSWDEAQLRARGRLFRAKTEMAMRCRGVGGTELGVKCCGMQQCCAGGRPGVRSCRSMGQAAASRQTNRVGAAARQF